MRSLAISSALLSVTLLLSASASVLFTGCTPVVGQSVHNEIPGPSVVPHTKEVDVDDDEALPGADPAFSAHFTDPIYSDPVGEFAPFGTDEGWDLLHEWSERHDELSSRTTVADLISESGFGDVAFVPGVEEGQGVAEPGGQVDAATITIGAAFTLLRLTGHIDEPGRQQTLKALDILIHRYDSPPELLRQRADLDSWAG